MMLKTEGKMKNFNLVLFTVLLTVFLCSCAGQPAQEAPEVRITAAEILGNPEYQAISFGAYRETTREIQPTIPQLKEDLRILHAMGIRLLRTYNVHYDETANLLRAIRMIREEDPEFEMYLMLGVWIDCKNAWTDEPERIRDQESERNAVEIARAVEGCRQSPRVGEPLRAVHRRCKGQVSDLGSCGCAYLRRTHKRWEPGYENV